MASLKRFELWEHCSNIAALKIVVANRLVEHRLGKKHCPWVSEDGQSIQFSIKTTMHVVNLCVIGYCTEALHKPVNSPREHALVNR